MPDRPILMGVFGRPHGVRGLLHVTSYTGDPAALAGYGELRAADGRRFGLDWRGVGVAAVTLIEGGARRPVADRDTAALLTNVQLFVDRDALPVPDEDEFYLADLIGLAATDAAGATLGRIEAVHDYGAGASLEIARPAGPPLLLPFTHASVPEIDVAAGRVVVLPPHEIEAAEDPAAGEHAA